MRPLKGKPFAVFHDAAQYFDRRYGLNYLGAFTLHPERGLSAGHVRELRARLVDKKAVCVFSEPGFDTRVIQNLTATTGALPLAFRRCHRAVRGLVSLHRACRAGFLLSRHFIATAPACFAVGLPPGAAR